jgi:UDP-N-acetyl-D-mannosaminuronic acid dehydrogenase
VSSVPRETKIIRTGRQVHYAKMPVACLGLAFKANIDDFRESPARFVAASFARRFGNRLRIAEPYAAELPAELAGTGAELIDIDTALESWAILIVLVDQGVFRVVPSEERGTAAVYDTRGIWPSALVGQSSPKLRPTA